jgi:hypothetical protein
MHKYMKTIINLVMPVDPTVEFEQFKDGKFKFAPGLIGNHDMT